MFGGFLRGQKVVGNKEYSQMWDEKTGWKLTLISSTFILYFLQCATKSM